MIAELKHIISVLVFLLFLQKGIYAMLVLHPISHARILFLISLFFAGWVLSDVALPELAVADMFEPFSFIGVAGWLLLPFFLNRLFSLLTQLPAKPGRRRLEYLLLFLLALQPLLTITFQWLNIPGRPAVLSPEGPWPVFLGSLMVVNVALLMQKVFAWKSLRKCSNVSFDLVFLPLSFFLGFSMFIEFILPATLGQQIIAITPWIGIIWFPFLIYTFRDRQNTGHEHVNIGQLAYEYIELPVFLIQADHSVFGMNPFARDLFPPSGIPGNMEKLSALFTDPSAVEECLEKANSEGHAACDELRLLVPGHMPVPFAAEFFQVRDRFQDVHGFAMVCKDLRESILLKETLSKLEKQCLAGQKEKQKLDNELGRRSADLAAVMRDLQIRISESLRMEERIETDLAERDVLINEIHNRVISNMNLIISLILSQESASLDSASAAKLREMAQRVRAILMVHQHLYLSINYSDVDFKGFLQDLTSQLLSQSQLEHGVQINAELSDEFLNVHQAIPLGMISNELITNVLNHAWPTGKVDGQVERKLHIRFEPNAEAWAFSITDNGIGLPENMEWGSERTIGLPLVEILVNDQLGGSLSISRPGGPHSRLGGTRLTVSFPRASGID